MWLPQNVLYSSERISVRVPWVNTYFLEPGRVSKVKRSRVRPSVVRLCALTALPRNPLENNDVKRDILLHAAPRLRVQ